MTFYLEMKGLQHQEAQELSGGHTAVVHRSQDTKPGGPSPCTNGGVGVGGGGGTENSR